MKKNDELSEAAKFEIMVSQIVSLLEGEKAKVSWNEKITDPDNPSQGRQIDVLVIKDNLVTLIECRLHKQPQNVKWIEELIGRQISLRANSIIGVSSSGFTKGAIAKANRFGITLRKIDELTSDEIIKWGKPIKLSLFYWRFISLRLDLFFENSELGSLNASDIMNELEKHPYLQNLLTTHLSFTDKTGLKLREKIGKKFHFHGDYVIENFTLSGATVKKTHIDCRAILEEIPLSIPQVLIYKDPHDDKQGTYIQNFNLGETRVIHNRNDISIILDISNLNLPPLCQFMFVDFHSNETLNIEYFELVGAENMKIKMDTIELTINQINT